jgi:tripartite-type tricarboxylate transporter receptor subunit TctC
LLARTWRQRFLPTAVDITRYRIAGIEKEMLMKNLVLATLLATSTLAMAQEWPAGKRVRVIVPYPAGGGVDFVSRVVSNRLGEMLKTTFIVENRTGASGTIGADAVAKSAPDGNTILIASPAEVLVGPISGQKTGYSAEEDLVPVTLIGETPLVIAAHPSVPANSLSELIALAKDAPAKYAYGTPGNGSSMHYAGESLNAIGKISMQHVPYRGAAPAIADLLGGQVPIGMVGMPPVLPFAKSGKLHVLAVTSARRSAAMPDVPAVSELPGFAGYRFTNWMGVYVPAKTPQAVVEKLAANIAQIVREPATREKLREQGVEPVGSSPTEFASFLRSERTTYAKIAADRDIRVSQ